MGKYRLRRVHADISSSLDLCLEMGTYLRRKSAIHTDLSPSQGLSLGMGKYLYGLSLHVYVDISSSHRSEEGEISAPIVYNQMYRYFPVPGQGMEKYLYGSSRRVHADISPSLGWPRESGNICTFG